METGKLLLEKALKLKPQDRFIVIEGLIKSLDEPDKDIDQIWAEEAEKRLKAYREGRLKGVPFTIRADEHERNQKKIDKVCQSDHYLLRWQKAVKMSRDSETQSDNKPPGCFQSSLRNIIKNNKDKEKKPNHAKSVIH